MRPLSSVVYANVEKGQEIHVQQTRAQAVFRGVLFRQSYHCLQLIPHIYRWPV